VCLIFERGKDRSKKNRGAVWKFQCTSGKGKERRKKEGRVSFSKEKKGPSPQIEPGGAERKGVGLLLEHERKNILEKEKKELQS